MSVIRLSVLKETTYAPYPNGNIEMGDYDGRRLAGKMETLTSPNIAKPNSKFRQYFNKQIKNTCGQLSEKGPVVVMVHGFLFDPRVSTSPDPAETDNPHGRAYHFQVHDEAHEQRHHTTNWPGWLGYEEDDSGEKGLAVAFGWQSSPGFASSLIQHFQNFYARAYEFAGKSAWVLVNTLAALADNLPNQRINIFCHSLGSRVVVRAIAMAAKQGLNKLISQLGQVIILGGSEYVVEAQLMQRRLNAAGLESKPIFYNIVSRENDVLDILGENFGPRTFGNSQVIGHNGLDIESFPTNWIDLQIDSLKLQKWMQKQRNIKISGDRPDNVWDHWYYYTFRGNMDLYKRILREPDQWDPENLRNMDPIIPDGVALRWWNLGD